MGILDIFKRKKDEQTNSIDSTKKTLTREEISNGYDQCQTLEEKEQYLIKIKKEIADYFKEANIEISKQEQELLNSMSEALKKEREEALKKENELLDRVNKFEQKTNALKNLPGQKKENELASKTAREIEDEYKKRKRNEFDNKFFSTNRIFSEFCRIITKVEDEQIMLDQKYDALFNIGIFKDIPKSYLQYVFLLEAKQAGVITNSETELLNQIENDPNFINRLDKLQLACVVAYKVLGSKDNFYVTNQIIHNPNDLNTLKDTINYSIKKYLDNPEQYIAMEKEMEKQDKLEEELFFFFYHQFTEEDYKIVLSVDFGKNLNASEKKLFSLYNNLIYKNFDDEVIVEKIPNITNALLNISRKLTPGENHIYVAFRDYCLTKKLEKLEEVSVGQK